MDPVRDIADVRPWLNQVPKVDEHNMINLDTTISNSENDQHTIDTNSGSIIKMIRQDNVLQKDQHQKSATWLRDRRIWYINNTKIQHSKISQQNHPAVLGQISKNNDFINRLHTNNIDQIKNYHKIIDSFGRSTDGSSIASVSTGTSGHVSCGEYEIKETIGKGNSSQVKLAQHKLTRHTVAIKIVKTSNLDQDSIKKIQREIEILKQINEHDNIIRLYQIIVTRRYFMFVTEYCGCGDLQEYLIITGRLNESDSCYYFKQILRGVEYLHDNNIVHRDLKAENLLLTDNFATIKIADFGFSNYFKKGELLSTHCGSPPYAAPELFQHLNYEAKPVDIWSLGVVLYVLVCGSYPFDGTDLLILRSRVLSGKFRVPFFMSNECESLLRSMIRVDSVKRYTISQIMSHPWIIKYGNQSKPDSPPNTKTSDTLKRAPSSCQLTDNEQCNQDISSSKYKSANTNSVGPIIQDSSMVCLNSDFSNQVTNMSTNSTSSKISCNIENEIVSAVSNMSIVSNHSTMSILRGYESKNLNQAEQNKPTGSYVRIKLKSTKGDSSDSMPSRTDRRSLIDDQILTFMVEKLRVTKGIGPIIKSIVEKRFDSLHAIYRLIYHEPKIVADFSFGPNTDPFDANNISVRAVIAGGDQFDVRMKASILGGVIDNSDPNKNFGHSKSEIRDKPGDLIISPRDSNRVNLTDVTTRDIMNNPNNNCQTHNEQLNLLNMTQNEPPQLFLTPPIEPNIQSNLKKEHKFEFDPQEVDSNKMSIIGGSSKVTPQVADVNLFGTGRHSFDSNMYDICAAHNNTNYQYIGTNNLNQTIWDSSILDTLAIGSTPYGIASGSDQQCREHGRQDHGHIDMNNINIDFQSNKSQDNSIPSMSANCSNTFNLQLNQMVPVPAMTLSVALPQEFENMELRNSMMSNNQFTPNNLVNQNRNILNNLALQGNLNNIFLQNNSTLLDPNGLASGFERRASDGQASYSSLTTEPRMSTADSGQRHSQMGITSLDHSQMTPQPISKLSYMTTKPIYNTQKCDEHITRDKQSRFNNDSRVQIGAHQTVSFDMGVENPQTTPLDLTMKTHRGSSSKN